MLIHKRNKIFPLSSGLIVFLILAVSWRAPVTGKAGTENSGFNTSPIDWFAHFTRDSLKIPHDNEQIPYKFLAVEAEGNYLYIATSHQAVLILDISNPADPVLIYSGFMDDFGFGEASAIVVKGNLLYLAYGSGGLRIIDVSNHYQPILVGSYAPWATYHDIYIQGNYAYIATGYPNYGMEIIDISNPAQPFSVGTFRSIWSDGNAIIANDIYVYLATDIVQILDVSNPSTPKEVGIYGTMGNATGLALAGKYIFTSWFMDLSWGGGLDIIDVSNPSSPVKAGQTFTPGRGQDVILARNYAFFADGTSGLRIFDATDPTSPVFIGQIQTIGNALDLDLSRNYLYMANEEAGLYIFHLNLFSITGYVVDVKGRPMSDIPIQASPLILARSENNGKFEFQYLTQGNYTFSPVTPLYNSLPATRTVFVPPNVNGQNFYILPMPVSVSLNPGLSATLSYTDTQGLKTTILFPANAVSETITITLTPAVASGEGGFIFTGHSFYLEASKDGIPLQNFHFILPVTVTIQYSDSDVDLLTDENEQVLWRISAQQHQDAAQSCLPPSTYTRNTENNLLSVPICQTGLLGSFGPTKQVNLPFITVP